MNITGNLGLTIWDLTIDDFDHGQLEDNWIAVDLHDHSPERGVQIGTPGIRTGAIVQNLIATNAVGSAQLQDGSVSTSKLQNDAVTADILATGSVTAAAIAPAAVGSPALDPELFPLGMVTNWWRPPGSNLVPGGFWEIMDGRPWSGITNSWGLTTGNIPDMRNKFAKGADVTGGPNIGQLYGASTVDLTHQHITYPHSHNIGNHTHGIYPDGSHAHTFLGGLQLWSRENAISPNVDTLLGYGDSQVNVDYYSMYLQGLTGSPWFQQLTQFGQSTPLQDGQTAMDAAGTHAHGYATGGAGAGATDSQIAGTTPALGETAVEPSNTGLVFMMRVR